jgi:hypothetical protein
MILPFSCGEFLVSTAASYSSGVPRLTIGRDSLIAYRGHPYLFDYIGVSGDPPEQRSVLASSRAAVSLEWTHSHGA